MWITHCLEGESELLGVYVCARLYVCVTGEEEEEEEIWGAGSGEFGRKVEEVCTATQQPEGA